VLVIDLSKRLFTHWSISLFNCRDGGGTFHL